MKRTHTCGELTKKNLQKEAVLCGWVQSRRDHGGLIFVDLRDRYGITQVVFDPSHNKQAHEAAQHLGREWVLQVTGHVRLRPQGMTNKNLVTGEIEVISDHLEILNQSDVPPIEVEDNSSEFNNKPSKGNTTQHNTIQGVSQPNNPVGYQINQAGSLSYAETVNAQEELDNAPF